MAPIALDSVDDELKDVIQHLYAIQSGVHGYLGPETQQELVRQITSLRSSLSTLHINTSPSNQRRHHLPLIPPEVVSYVDSARNPDIYTREFVELVKKGNKTVKGKSEAFGSFRDILAQEMASAIPDIKGEVDKVVEYTKGQGHNKSKKS